MCWHVTSARVMVLLLAIAGGAAGQGCGPVAVNPACGQALLGTLVDNRI